MYIFMSLLVFFALSNCHFFQIIVQLTLLFYLVICSALWSVLFCAVLCIVLSFALLVMPFSSLLAPCLFVCQKAFLKPLKTQL